VSEHDDRLVRRVMHAASGAGAPGACPDAEVLALFAERALDEDERHATEAHVAACRRCQAAVVAFLRSEAPAAAGAGAVGAVVPWWARWRWLVPVAATAAVVTVAVWVRQPDSRLSTAPAAERSQAERDSSAPRAEPGTPTPTAPSASSAASPDAEGARAAAAGPADSRAEDLARRQGDPVFRFSAPPAKTQAPAAPSDASREEPARQALADAALSPASPPVPGRTADQLARANDTPPPPAPAAVKPPPAVMAEPPARDQGESQRAEARRADAAAGSPPPAGVSSPPSVAETVTVAPAAPAREEIAAAAPSADSRGARGARAAGGVAGTEPAAAQKAAGRAAGSSDEAAAAPRAETQAGRTPLSGSLTGRVTYRARVALPAGAVIEIRLLDVSRVDAPAALVARREVETRGEQVPVPFTLAYDPRAIDPRRRYAVEATITIDGRIAWRSTTAQAALTAGAPVTNVEIVVQQLR
jgi:uncharacterized lipoprotein YbaY